MRTITDDTLRVPASWPRPIVAVVPRPRARARLPELPCAPLAGSALIVGASVLLVAGMAGLFL